MTATTEKLSIYQPDQPGLKFPTPPSFETAAEERLHRKQRLAGACRAFAKFGFGYGTAGHLTVRDPENPDLYWTNPFAVNFRQVRVSNLILVDHAGMVVEGEYAANRAGFVLHSAIHTQHPEIVASCHAHTVHGAAFAAMGRPLDPITQDVAAFFEHHTVVSDQAGAIVVEEDAGKEVGSAFGDNKAMIHQNHGLFSAGTHSIDEAAWWFIALEHACRVQLLADASRIPPKPISEDAARHTRHHFGTPFIGWLNFQPIYESLVAEQPDLLE
ncbi:class II aldolase/adducin family protein [Enemella evansiae]|uniref:class II aldolase/adducin family protein n=1 Tax=Enemella evansiae TaxID=2016499 RepID=UPI000B967F52|nr:class II aldolase/adducin family protein [Enemella evansiae]OYN96994.1 class II aldolase/adducin family protein [Enemella evansiae]OYO00574.1 class II aldolase/adducin family protein [Enemella evansiae]OYO06164.1 class II aldolase/adducin family protein [Enemella evansiae]